MQPHPPTRKAAFSHFKECFENPPGLPSTLSVETHSNVRTVTEHIWGKLTTNFKNCLSRLPGAASAQSRKRPTNWECFAGCWGRLHFPKMTGTIAPDPMPFLKFVPDTLTIKRWNLCSPLNLGGFGISREKSLCSLKSSGINSDRASACFSWEAHS